LLLLGVSGIAGLPGFAEQKGTDFPAEWRRYEDPATELEVLRLTDPAYSSFLPAAYNRFHARRNSFLIFSSDRTGGLQAFHLDLKNGQLRQLTEAAALDARSLSLLPDERNFCYFDGDSLRTARLDNLRDREVYRVPQGWRRCKGCSVSADGQRAFFGERQGGRSRIRAVALRRGSASTVAEVGFDLSDPVPNPRRAQVLYRQGDDGLWLVNMDGKQNRQLPLADGRAGAARWSPDGRSIIYLHFPSDPKRLNALREYFPDENVDKAIGNTSQFVQFASNGDTSVFVGASRNRAAPHVLLFLRVSRREFTLCEHAATDPSSVEPVFSPDSQRIYFESDRHGKPALYAMRVEKLVESTEESGR
jgi:Tol biopolymer transport system component